MDTREVICYVRVSTGEQAEKGLSLEVQKAKTLACAGAFFPDYKPRMVQDVGSGTSDRRKGFQEIQKLASAGRVRAIVVVDLDRLCRSTSHFLHLLDLCLQRDVALFAMGQNINTGTDIGRMVATIIMSVAEFESSAISRRVKRVLAHQREKKKKGPGLRPYGWNVNATGELERNPEEQRGIDIAMGMRARNHAWQEVAKALSDGGFRTVTGAAWSAESARGVMQRATQRRSEGF